MRKRLLFACLFLPTALLLAQGPHKRYVTVEHFTNSKCPICASRNPAFYNLIQQYPEDLHHVSIHPSIPYNTCVFYQANTTENTAWTNWYSISSTPRVALNGTLVPASGQLLPSATLQAALGQTSNLRVKVQETAGSTRTVTVTTYTNGTGLPAGDYRLYAAVVEKTINQATPNGETVHYNVFRDMVGGGMDGAVFTDILPGQSTTYQFTYTVNAAWNANEVYVLAFVKNINTGEILNSGTKFDPQVTATTEPEPEMIKITPNPATTTCTVQCATGSELKAVELFNLGGLPEKVPVRLQPDNAVLDLSALRTGIYLLRTTTNKGVFTRKLVKN